MVVAELELVPLKPWLEHPSNWLVDQPGLTMHAKQTENKSAI